MNLLLNLHRRRGGLLSLLTRTRLLASIDIFRLPPALLPAWGTGNTRSLSFSGRADGGFVLFLEIRETVAGAAFVGVAVDRADFVPVNLEILLGVCRSGNGRAYRSHATGGVDQAAEEEVGVVKRHF